MTTTTVYIDQDPATLGPDATADDLDTYAARLEAHLEERFNRPINVEQTLDGTRAGHKYLADEEIDAYVRDLEAGDGWIGLLP
jgi:hypothetical protein